MRVNVNSLASKFVAIEGVKLHYQEVGEGPTVICIHGAGPGASAASNFAGNVGPLSNHFRTILFDMPQYGKSSKVTITEGRLSYNARILNGFMQQLGIESASIIGNSMGGQVALKLGLDFPNRLDKVVVVGSAPVAPIMTPFPVEGIKLIDNYYKGEGPTREKLRQLINTMVYDSSFVTDALFEERFQASIDPEIIAMQKAQGKYVRERLGNDLPNLKAKLLIFWGMDDRMGALDVGLQMMRLAPNARMHLFSRCGHWAQVEHADEFNRLAIDFLLNA
jgi:pimeloyl-ACP methyl ester carboxylesterase